MIDHHSAPIFEALARLHGKHISFHVPGHKNGSDFDDEGSTFFRALLSIDQTEISGLDDLHHAQGIIHEAEILASHAFRSEETKFLVGGTTAGILALILGAIRPGDRLLIQRNSHKSILNGLRMCKGEPVFVNPDIDQNTGIPTGVSPEKIAYILERDKGIKAVFLTSPNYYGFTSDIQKIASIVHKHGLPLLVDEAHGAHFAFHPNLPLPALVQGADGVVQSTHKTLPAMTMASMLHFQGKRINRDRVKQWLTMIQSSSPSYPLMASLDLARRYMMVGKGKKNLDQMLNEVIQLRPKLKSLSWVNVLTTDDPLRLTLSMGQGIPFEIQTHLQQYEIYPELIEMDRMVFVFTGGNTKYEIEQLWRALSNFSTQRKEQKLPIIPEELWLHPIIDLNKFWDEPDGEWVKIKDAAGRFAASMIVPYPPGIPFILIGQKITKEIAEVIEKLLSNGLHVQGITHNHIFVWK